MGTCRSWLARLPWIKGSSRASNLAARPASGYCQALTLSSSDSVVNGRQTTQLADLIGSSPQTLILGAKQSNHFLRCLSMSFRCLGTSFRCQSTSFR